MVKDILVATGVDAGRLSTEAKGEDASRLRSQVILQDTSKKSEVPELLLDNIEKGCHQGSPWFKLKDP
jgi:hypothetical protein